MYFSGAPGRYHAVGGAFAYNLGDHVDTPAEMTKIPKAIPEEDTIDKYIGASSAVCDMDGDSWNGLEYVFGGPRGAMYNGEVKSGVETEILILC